MLARAARAHGLFVSGIAPVDAADGLPDGLHSLHLLSPDEPGFWAHVTAQPEFVDGQPDPLDRWSARVITTMADALGGRALFPFGQPARPFISWALRSQRATASPVGMLCHDRMGLWASYRGAIALPSSTPAAPAQTDPCKACPAPCTTACPAGALTKGRYDTAACHAHLDTQKGTDCMNCGCAARRACPIGQSYGRLDAQSAWHMRLFHR